jgi:hypothetical protein
VADEETQTEDAEEQATGQPKFETDPNSDPKIDTEGEFPTDWHRDAHITALERELEGRKVLDDTEGAKNAERELARLKGHGQRGASKRPARAAESR